MKLQLSFILLVFVIGLQALAQPNEMKTDIGITRGRDRHLWPIFFRETTSDYKKLEAAASLYTYYRFYSDSSLHTHFLPLYSYDSSLLGKQVNIGTTFYPSLFVYESKFQQQIKSYRAIELLPYVNMVEFTKSAQGDYLKNNLLFFLWYKNDRLTKSSHLVLFPLFWNYKNTYNTNLVVLPLFYKYQNFYTHSKGFVSPLYFAFSDSISQSKVAFPLYWQLKYDSLSSDLFLPFYLNRKIVATSDTTITKAYTPFYWLNQRSNAFKYNQENYLLPFYVKRRHVKLLNELKHVDPALEQETKQTLFPVFWKTQSQVLTYSKAELDFEHKQPFYSASELDKKALGFYSSAYVFPNMVYNKTITKENINTKWQFWPLLFSKYTEIHGEQAISKTELQPYKRTNKQFTALPVYWKNRKTTTVNNKDIKEAKSLVLFPLLAVGSKYNNSISNQTFKSSFLGITPLYWYNSSQYFNFKETAKNSESSTLEILGSSDKKQHFLFPIYFNSKNVSQQFNKNDTIITMINKTYVLPLFWNSSNRMQSAKLGLTTNFKHIGLLPFTAYGVNQKNNKSYFAATPLFWHVQSDKYKFNMLFPVYYGRVKQYNNNTGKVTSHWLLPVWHSRVDSLKIIYNNEVDYQIKKSNTVFPLYHQSLYNKVVDGNKTTVYKLTSVTPLYWRFKNHYKKFVSFVPVWWQYKVDLPGEKTSFFMLLPLVQHQKSTSTWPLQNNMLDSGMRVRNYTVIVPFYSNSLHFSKRSEAPGKIIYDYRAQKFVAPFYWQIKDSAGILTYILPLYVNQSIKTDSSQLHATTIFPVYFAKQQRTFLKSLNQHELKKHQVAFPFHYNYFRQSITANADSITHSTIATLPFFLRYRYADNKIQRTTYGITPLVWYTTEPNNNWLVILPNMYYNKSNTANEVTKLVGIWPIYKYQNILFFKNGIKTSYEYQHHIFPIYWLNRDSLWQNNSLVRANNSQVLLPFYWHNNSVFNSLSGKIFKSKYTALLPFYINTYKHDSVDNATRSTIATLPFYIKINQTDKKYSNTTYGITPLVWINKNNVGKSLLVLPNFYVSKTNTQNLIADKFVVWPIYKQHKSERFNNGIKTQHNQHAILFPLYWFKNDSAWDKGNLTQITRNRNLLPLFVSNSNFKSELLEAGKVETQTNHNMAALLWWHKSIIQQQKSIVDKKYNFNKSVVFPLYWQQKQAVSATDSQIFNGKQMVLFPLLFSFKTDSNHQKSATLGLTPLFWHTTKNNQSATMVLPVFGTFYRNKYKSYTLLPVFSIGKNTQDALLNHTVITPLFWLINQKHKQVHMLLPFYVYTKHKPTQTAKLNIGLWLYQHTKSDTSFEFNVLWPLVGYNKTPTKQSFYATPLVWLNKQPDLKYTAILPFYYGVETEYYRKKYLLGPLYVHTKQKGVFSKNTFLAGTYKNINYVNGDYERRLLHLLYANCSVNNERLNVLFPFYYTKHFANGNYTKSYGLTFYNSIKRKVPNTEEYYREVKLLWFLRYKSNYAYLQNKGIKVDRKKLK